MTKNYSFLPLLLNEEIYLVRESSNLNMEVQAVAPNETMAPQEVAVPGFVFQGKNQKQVAVLVEHHGVELATTQQELLLKNILSAMNLNFNDIALINLAHPGNHVDLEGLKRIGCKVLIGFGINPEKILSGQRVESNKLTDLDNIQILLSYSLDDLQQDKEKKKLLWRNLKSLFDL